jgi:hypothetical protein
MWWCVGSAGNTGVDELPPGLSSAYDGVSYPVHHLTTTAFRADQDPPPWGGGGLNYHYRDMA